MSNNDNSSAAGTAIFVGAGLVTLMIWQFARAIGADFPSTANALGSSLLSLTIVGGVWWLFRPGFLLTLGGALLFIWPCWWGVLDSIARGGIAASDFSFRFQPEPFYVLWYFKGGVELVLLGFTIWAFFREHSDY